MSALLALAAAPFFAPRPGFVDRSFDFTTAADLSAFTGTAVNAGTASTTSSGLPNGVLRLSGAATTDDSGYELQLASMLMDLGADAVAQIVAGHTLSTIAGEWLLGFGTVDTSLIASAPTDGIYLHKLEDVATVELVSIRDGVAVTRQGGALGKASFQSIGFQVRCQKDSRKAEIVVFADGERVYAADGKGADLFTDVPDDAVLAPSYAFRSGSAVGTQTVDLDYLRVGFSRA